jgi:hypothetical protein
MIRQVCTKELIAKDCMEYVVFCHVDNSWTYIGLTCHCETCVLVCKETNNLEVCPNCKGPLIEHDPML